MKTFSIFLFFTVVLISCKEESFCGIEVKNKNISTLIPVNDNESVRLALDLALHVALKEGDYFKPHFHPVYLAPDTVIVKVTGLPDKKFARKLSCILMNYSEFSTKKNYYVCMEWKDGKILLKK